VAQKYQAFKRLLEHNQRSLEFLTTLEEIWHTGAMVDWARIQGLTQELCQSNHLMIDALIEMNPVVYKELESRFHEIASSLLAKVSLPDVSCSPPYVMGLRDETWASDLAGEKARSLNRILTNTYLAVPRGFVITTHAFQLFLEHNRLRPRLDKLLAKIRLEDMGRLESLSREIQALIQGADMPRAAAEAVSQKIEDLAMEGVTGPWAVRSSACGEDGERGWAGQYTSVLHVGSGQVLKALQTVMAGKYATRALVYRVRRGLADTETPMAALVMEMVEPAVSGVIYTIEQGAPDEDPCLAIYAVTGLCERLVNGSAIPEGHYLSREPCPRVRRRLTSDGQALKGDSSRKALISREIAVLLAKAGMELEKLAGTPQDIEWVQDVQGNVFFLQSRPLSTGPGGIHPSGYDECMPDREPLLTGGITASPGVGIGPVFLVRGEDDLLKVPRASVLVSATLPPSFASVMDRVHAVVADGGSRASHFASVAREHGLPVMVGALRATEVLPACGTVTVDATRGRVYPGVAENLKARPGPSPGDAKTPFSIRLRSIMALVSPLHLTDPAAPDFTPRHCSSMHDLIRFCHEKGMVEMFSVIGSQGRGLGRTCRLTTDLPLVMYVLDLEEAGIPRSPHRRSIDLASISCEPMQAFWKGLGHPDVVWRKGLMHTDWEGFDRISAGVFSLRSAALASYALFSKDYLHLHLRFGYHFAITDALCASNPDANYVAFRFKGGGGHLAGRLLRVQFIRMVLEWAGFAVNAHGDLLEARFDRHGAGNTLCRLTLLGLLQGKTLLMDMTLTHPDQVEELTRSFKEHYQEYGSGACGPEST